MNILFLFDLPFSPNKGGIERVSNLLASELNKRGHSVYFLSICKPKIPAAENTKVLSPNNNPESLLIDTLFHKNIDIIINQSQEAVIVPYLKIARDNSIKVISVLHNQPFPIIGKEVIYKKLSHVKNIKSKIIKYLTLLIPIIYRQSRLKFERNKYREIIKNSDKYYLLSEKYIDRIKKYFPDIESYKLDAINNPNTFELSSIEKIKKENIILFVGRLYDPQKNITGFIDIWKKFSQTNSDWKAIIAGDGPDRDQLEKYAFKKKIKNLHFLGNMKNISDLYPKSKILCMTSLYEGWPMVLTEAMAHGCVPVVFNTFEAINEIIVNNINGIIVKPFNMNMMLDALNKLSHNEDLRDNMAKSCIKYIEKFSLSKIADIWTKKLSELFH